MGIFRGNLMPMNYRHLLNVRGHSITTVLVMVIFLFSLLGLSAFSQYAEEYDSIAIPNKQSTDPSSSVQIDHGDSNIESPSTNKPIKMNVNRDYEYNYTDVLLVYNEASGLSTRVAQYFQNARNIPNINMCNITTSTGETVSRAEFDNIRAQIESYLDDNNLTDKINYIVTTKGVPLRVSGGANDRACLDSELTMIKGDYQNYIGNNNWAINPYFEDNEPFSREKYSIYLVTRLTAFTEAEIYNFIDNATISLGNRGTYVLDVDATKGFQPTGYGYGNIWLRDANQILTEKGEQTFYDDTNNFITGQSNVIGYASWGANDAHDTTNFMTNYGFDSTTNDFPNNWYPIYDPGITDNITSNTTDSYSGSKSVTINRTGTSLNFTGLAQNVTITPGYRYYLRSWVNVTQITGSGGAHVQIQALDSSNKILKVQNTNIRTSVTASWRAFSQVIYEPVPSAVKVRIIVMLNQSSGLVNFDHITFNDINPHNFWVPGSIAETYVSTGGRSFTYGTSYGQSLIADLIRDGVTGIKGYVYEPYLMAIAHPDIIFDRYTDGYNFAESFYMASNLLGWMDVVVGDPKMEPYYDTLSDLNISLEGLRYSPSKPDQDIELEFNYIVTNLGNRTAPNVNVKLFEIIGAQETQIDEQVVDNITGSGGIAKLQTKYIPTTVGDIKYKIIIDSADKIKEPDEYNNMIQKNIYINSQPAANKLESKNDSIYRGEEFGLIANGEDLETGEGALIPIIEAKLEPSGFWFMFEDEQINYEFDLINNNWTISIRSNTSMELGEYSFRISFIDENNYSSNYYNLHFGLEVLNNQPILKKLEINRTSLFRGETLNVSCEAFDLEDLAEQLIIEMHYRYKPLGSSSSTGWETLTGIIYDSTNNRWWSIINFEIDFELGNYQFRARVTDTDLAVGSWEIFDSECLLLNNLPNINNITFSTDSIYRSQEVELLISGTDLEDKKVLGLLTFEIEYSLKPTTADPEPADYTWETNYLTKLQFDDFDKVWEVTFQPPIEATLGEYLFRARFLDQDLNWSEWYITEKAVTVLNNLPVAKQTIDPEINVFEDDVIAFDAKASSDIEDGNTKLTYQWEINAIPIFTSNNQSFSFSFSEAGEYLIILKVTDTDLDFTWDNQTIIIENVEPTAKISVELKKAFVNDVLTFSAKDSSDTSSDLDTLIYRWDFGDGETGSGLSVNHSFSEPGTYTVTLYVEDGDGAEGEESIKIIIEPIEKVPSESKEDFGLYYALTGVIIIIIVLLIILAIVKKRKQKPAPPPEQPPPQQMMPMPPMGPAPMQMPPIPPPEVAPTTGTLPQQEPPGLTKMEGMPQLPPPQPGVAPEQEPPSVEGSEPEADKVEVSEHKDETQEYPAAEEPQATEDNELNQIELPDTENGDTSTTKKDPTSEQEG